MNADTSHGRGPGPARRPLLRGTGPLVALVAFSLGFVALAVAARSGSDEPSRATVAACRIWDVEGSGQMAVSFGAVAQSAESMKPTDDLLDLIYLEPVLSGLTTGFDAAREAALVPDLDESLYRAFAGLARNLDSLRSALDTDDEPEDEGVETLHIQEIGVPDTQKSLDEVAAICPD